MIKFKTNLFFNTRTCLFSFLLFMMLPAVGVAGINAQERPQEEVTVTAVEVPVRVLLKGEPVRGLTRESFEVYENGIKQEITQFEVVSRKIVSPAPDQESSSRKRLFLLIFNVFDYNDSVGEAIDYFFRDIFKPGDQVIILTEDRVLDIERGKGVEELIDRIKEALKKFKSLSTRTTLKNFSEINREADRLLAVLRGQDMESAMNKERAMLRFFGNHQKVWEDYRNQFLTPDVTFYRNLIQRLRAVEGEKWAVCFQQREMFPQIKSASRLDFEVRSWVDSQVDPLAQVSARLVQARQQDLQRSFDFKGNINPDALSDLFLGSHFTFHLILMKSSMVVLSQDLELKEVGRDYEEVLSRISRATGGYATFSTQAAAALREAAELEDYHYLLVYSPKDSPSQKKREIEVKVNRSGVDVVYLKQVLE
ncbi:MAG: hypothetical protein FJY81_01780, partial [Candidatus Aminicenantes bacterium]|nr:hypothetical protein [Candidatus Aminicenantes bacterium]